MTARLWLIMLALLTTTAQAQSTLQLADKFAVDSRPTQLDREGRLVFQSTQETLSVQIQKVVRWCGPQSVSPGPAIALLDGSWLSGQLRWLNDNRVRLQSPWFEAIELDISQVRAVIMNASPSWPETEQLQRQLLTPTGSQDVLWTRGNQSAPGIIHLEIKPGIEPLATERAAVRFKAQGASTAVEIAPADLLGITLSPVLRRSITSEPATPVLTLVDGSRLLVKELKLQSNGHVECVLPAGQRLISLDESAEFAQAIAAIHAQPPEVIWLSGLEPARYRRLESDSRVPWPLGRDRDLFGQRMFDRRGHAIDHCLVMHSPSQVAYRPPVHTQRFLASVQIDPQPASGSPMGPFGSAICQILVGRGGQLVKVWESATIRAGDSPVMVDADVSNSQLVVLLVDQADLGTLGDHVLWRDARLVTQSKATATPPQR